MTKEVRVSIEAFGEATVDVIKDNKGVRTFANGFGFQEWGILDEKTGELITNGNDITTNYLEVASQKALAHLGFNAKISQASPLKRKIEVLSKTKGVKP